MKLKVKCHSCLGFSLKRIIYCIKILELENMHIAFTYMHLMKEFFYPKKKNHLKLLQNHAAYFLKALK